MMAKACVHQRQTMVTKNERRDEDERSLKPSTDLLASPGYRGGGVCEARLRNRPGHVGLPRPPAHLLHLERLPCLRAGDREIHQER